MDNGNDIITVTRYFHTLIEIYEKNSLFHFLLIISELYFREISLLR